MQTLLKAQNLAHKFENLLYENINFELKAGEKIAILGVSGSGKSTILNNLSTMLKPTSGRVEMLGNADIYALKDSQILKIRRNEIGIIFQAHYLFRAFSARENLQIAQILSGEKIDMQMLENFGIAHTLTQSVGELSGGQQQRLSIARILTKKPKIIFADEPTGNLDEKTALDVMRCIFDYIDSQNAGLIIATHDNKIAQMCDKIFHLQNAQLLQEK